ncbi:hypothetical protein O181_076727 [Austropuccinia psidii MF-1]|uniref:Uncharacterized protein n=1 Tax=Austropuccinia psidii MF-1 TaxID=1389203 RepID=A0A9Q3IE25_9BASI|nr:hypothetical protein [Austropuccinia psidii MF-1]
MQNLVNKISLVNLELEEYKKEQRNEAKVSLHLTDTRGKELSTICNSQRKACASIENSLGSIIFHEGYINSKIDRPYHPLLMRVAYPERAKSREDFELKIQELCELVAMRNIGNNEEVKITTPNIRAWNSIKYRTAGDFRAPNNYTFLDMDPIPKI